MTSAQLPQVVSTRRAMPFDCPRGLSREQAARYIGVSPGTLDRLVEDKLMPKAKRIRGRIIFDRRELDAAFDALGEDPVKTNDFDVAL